MNYFKDLHWHDYNYRNQLMPKLHLGVQGSLVELLHFTYNLYTTQRKKSLLLWQEDGYLGKLLFE